MTSTSLANKIVSLMKNKGETVEKIKRTTKYIKQFETDFSIIIPDELKAYMSISHDIKNVHGVITAFDDDGEDSYVTLIAQSLDEPFKEYRRIWENYKSLVTSGYLPIGFFEDAGPLCVDLNNENSLVFIDEESMLIYEDENFYRTVIAASFDDYLAIYFTDNTILNNAININENLIEDFCSNEKNEIETKLKSTDKIFDGRGTKEFDEAKLLFSKWFPDSNIIDEDTKKCAGQPEISWIDALRGLDDLIDQNVDYEYDVMDFRQKNKKVCLGSQTYLYSARKEGKEVVYFYPLADVWMKYYEEHIKYPMVLIQMFVEIIMSKTDSDYGMQEHIWSMEVFGKSMGEVREYKHPALMKDIIARLIKVILEDLEHYNIEKLYHVDRDEFYFGWVLVDYLAQKDNIYLQIDSYPQWRKGVVTETITISEHTFGPALLGLSFFAKGVKNNSKYLDLGLSLLKQFVSRKEWKETTLINNTESDLIYKNIEP